MRILVTDGNNRASLAITRALGRLNHKVYVGEATRSSLAASSKYCLDAITYPNPNIDPMSFVTYLADRVKELDIDVLIPVADVTTLLLTQHSNDYFSSCMIPCPDYATVSRAADKAEITRLAQKIGVPVPRTIFLNNRDDIRYENIDIPYPIVIKPSRSRIFIDDRWEYTSVCYARDVTQLREILKNKPKYEFPILLQERINGPGIGIFLCAQNGKTIAHFSHRRLREKPPSGGVSVLRESIEADPSAKLYSENLLTQLNWHGVAMVEFKLDTRDQTPKLMEINGRFWGSLQLAIDSGVNFPEYAIAILTNEHIEPITSYKTGIQSRWLWGDIDSLLMLLFKSRSELNLPPDHDSRVVAILKFLKFWGGNLRYEVISTDDMKPWLYETKRWFKPDT